MNIKDYVSFKTLGYGLLAYAGVSYVMAQTGAIQGIDVAWFNKLFMWIAAAVASFFLDGKKITIYNVIAKVISYFTGKTNNTPVVTNDVFDSLDVVTEAFTKLGDKEGVALCKTVNGRLFDATYNVKTEVVADVQIQ